MAFAQDCCICLLPKPFLTSSEMLPDCAASELLLCYFCFTCLCWQAFLLRKSLWCSRWKFQIVHFDCMCILGLPLSDFGLAQRIFRFDAVLRRAGWLSAWCFVICTGDGEILLVCGPTKVCKLRRCYRIKVRNKADRF